MTQKQNKKNYNKKLQSFTDSWQRKYSKSNRVYLLDEKHLQYLFSTYIEMSDEEFIQNIEEVLHFAVYVVYLKDIPTKDVMGDEGLIHELVHLLKKSTRNEVDIDELRENFNKLLIIPKKFVTLQKKQGNG